MFDLNSIRLLDGATGTELGRRGVDLTGPLWATTAMMESPETLERVHREFLDAGAEAITTNTFRAHERSLARAGLAGRMGDIVKRAVEIAQRARDAVNPEALVLGSVGPLEDCYEPNAAPRQDLCAFEHGRMIETLLSAGVDCLLIETMSTLREAEAAADRARELAPDRWMISLLPKSIGPPGVLLSGESMLDLMPALEGARGIGVNCLSAPGAEQQVHLLRSFVPNGVHRLVYANVGEMDEAGRWRQTDAEAPEVYADYAERWLAAGATLIGGCCGTTPETIRALTRRRALARPNESPR